MRVGTIACIILLCSGNAPAQVYKWVDANGVTHYGAQPPANSKAREVKLREATPAPAAGAAQPPAAAGYKEREIEFRKRQTLRDREETRLAEEKAQRDQDCRRSRMELADLRTSRRLYDMDDKGERVFMSDAQRDAEIARREADYNRRCG